ncbi:MAG: polysaccharide deacetylase family protein [Candidatus Muirbacterium halophilum]|nr:polysaccharide deacetylase family protein [Candidatus Muirbacterium halophilum]MCK9476291.1 polysaccharide deacetylase family protein [Candidatus Muirbacterium halophilum]
MIYFSIDLEFWYNSPLLKKTIYKEYPDYMEETVDFLLKKLKNTNNKATFFVLGSVCEKYPKLIRKIALHGHEIAFHSYDHKLLNNKDKDEYYKECLYWKNEIERVSGKKVYGHRAPAWSYTNWLYDVLEKCDFKYDSSKNELRFHKAFKENKYNIKEYIVRNFGFGYFSIPFAGSIFFRIIPYFILRFIIKYNEKKFKNVIIYTHPWEFFDSSWIKSFKLPVFFKLYNFSFIKNNRKKLNKLLLDFKTESFYK